MFHFLTAHVFLIVRFPLSQVTCE
uniref:Uncharacterized protein n=1 Tax=Rhizophora mucronata TaxID=61149 RepID=A0A2P2KUM4_RHIMU